MAIVRSTPLARKIEQIGAAQAEAKRRTEQERLTALIIRAADERKAQRQAEAMRLQKLREMAEQDKTNVSRRLKLKRAEVSLVARAACNHFGISYEVMTSDARHALLVHARRVAMLIAHEDYGASTIAIGHVFNRDHTTVIQALRNGRAQLADMHPMTVADVYKIRAILRKFDADEAVYFGA